MPASVSVQLLRATRGLLALVPACIAFGNAGAQRSDSAARQWTLDSPRALVAQIQGAPTLIERLASFGYVAWHYRGGWIRLDMDERRVTGWSNSGGLKVRMAAGPDTTRATTFTMGSTRDDLVRLEGTPSEIIPRADLGEQLWRYGRATVRVGLADMRVRSWDDPSRTLHTHVPSVASRLLRPQPRGPVSLSATLSFADEGRDGVLDAEERATISVEVRNTGTGVAYDAALALVATPTSAITIVSATAADSIAPGRTITLRAVVLASAALENGDLSLRVGVREGNGFDLDPAPIVSVKTRAFLAPHFTIDGIGVADQSGNRRIEPREIVDITARIVNNGAGDARNVRATIVPGTGITLTPESQADVAIGTLRAGEARDVRVAAFANSRAVGFPLSIVVRESHTRFDTTFVLPLALDRPLASTQTLVVRGTDAPQRSTPVPLIVDVDSGIPRAPRRNTVAVVLGVERYQRALAAPFARHDAAIFREYATNVFGVGDDANHLFFRTDDEVTGGELRKVFDTGGWLSRRVTPETDVVVYFAGHGVSDLKSRAPFLLPNDADPNYPAQTGYALSELYEQLAALGARSVTVFIDACFSGSTRDGTSLFAGARNVVVSVEHPALRSETMAVFTASSGSQLASAAPERQHGLFTYWLLKGLRGDADADTNKRISVNELERFLRSRVSDDAARQDREQQPEVVARNKARIVVERQ